MARGSKKKPPTPKNGQANTGPLGYTPHAWLIRFPDREAAKRAIMVLGEVPVPYCGTEAGLALTKVHIEALEREGIPFEEVP